MRLANHDGRAFVCTSDVTGADVHTLSAGRFGPTLPALYEVWDDLRTWANGLDAATLARNTVAIDRTKLAAPSPAPRQVFAIGLNYDSHAAESDFETPTHLPPVFPKYVSAFSGPDSTVTLPPGGNVDWEIELVLVIGRQTSHVDESDAWSHVAGLTAGQDISERVSQLRGPAPQFGLGKSFAGFAPQGPWLVTPDELSNPDDLELGCAIDGEEVQKGRTRHLISPIARLIAGLSQTVTLYPGDVVFTGTPDGVGLGREPQRFLRPGEHLDSWIEDIGELHQTFIADSRGTVGERGLSGERLCR